jgi:serine/threonine protein kinase
MKFTYPNEARPVDGFTIRRGIHRGGFGEVYYAVSDAGKEVALKLLTHDLDTELRGIRQCLNLKHPNLVTIFDVKTDGDGDQWVIMEYVQGASLDDVLAAFPQGLPLAEVRDWLQGICAGVEYLHDRGIVHRDLKPANVYRENGVVKIGDVGLSKRMGGDRRSHHTESVGTVYYMAPEVAQGKYGPGVDVYSLGIMAYEMITGRLPFDGETTAEILMKHLTAPVDLKPLPEALQPVIARALEKDPKQRTAKVREFADELRRAMNGTTPLPESAFLPASPPPLKRDTGRAHDTSRRNGWQASSTPAKSARNTHSLNAARSATPQPHAPWWRGWLPWLALAALLFIPWSSMSWSEAGIMLSVAGLWGGALYALAWWCTPVNAQRSLTATATLPPLNADGTFAEQLSGSLLLGAPLSAGLAVAGLWGFGWFEKDWLQGSPSEIALLMGVAALATSTVLAASQAMQRRGQAFSYPSTWAAGLGAGVGAAAYALDGFLMAQFPDLRQSSRSAFDHLAAHPLWVDHQPTIVAYMVFFAITFGLQNWRKLLDPYRDSRLMVGAIVTAGFVGWMASMLFGVPRPYAVVWAVAITTAAQLAAPWQPGGNVRKVDVKTA